MCFGNIQLIAFWWQYSVDSSLGGGGGMLIDIQKLFLPFHGMYVFMDDLVNYTDKKNS